MSECLFCGVKGQAERLCGCDVCTMCSSGAYSAGLQRWGLELSEERWEETTSGDNPQTRHVLRVTVKYPSTLRLEAHFTREGPLNRVRKFFGHKEMPAGDPLFDRFVWVDAEFQEDLAELLTTEAFQSAVMELVSSGGVRLGEGWVRITRGRPSSSSRARE